MRRRSNVLLGRGDAAVPLEPMLGMPVRKSSRARSTEWRIALHVQMAEHGKCRSVQVHWPTVLRCFSRSLAPRCGPGSRNATLPEWMLTVWDRNGLDSC